VNRDAWDKPGHDKGMDFSRPRDRNDGRYGTPSFLWMLDDVVVYWNTTLRPG
jgi:hypothetical protein